MSAKDFAGRTVAQHVEAFTSGKVSARDLIEVGGSLTLSPGHII